jgi:hypothetical protein
MSIKRSPYCWLDVSCLAIPLLLERLLHLREQTEVTGAYVQGIWWALEECPTAIMLEGGE